MTPSHYSDPSFREVCKQFDSNTPLKVIFDYWIEHGYSVNSVPEPFLEELCLLPIRSRVFREPYTFYRLHFTPGGDSVVATDRWNSIKYYDLACDSWLVTSMERYDSIVDSNGKYVAGTSNLQRFIVSDITQSSSKSVVYDTEFRVDAHRFSPDGTRLVLWFRDLERLVAVDLRTEETTILAEKVQYLTHMDFVGNSHVVGYVNNHGFLTVLDLNVPRTQKTLYIPSREFSVNHANGTLIMHARSAEGDLVAFDLTGRRVASPWSFVQRDGRIIVCSPDGRWMYVSNYLEGVLYDRDNPTRSYSFFSSNAAREQIAFSPDSRLLAVGDHSGGLYIWDLSYLAVE